MIGWRRRNESGSITPFVVIVSLGILLVAALVVDGGRQLNAKGRAVAYAQEAARAGAQAVDVTDPKLDLLPGEAVRAAATYCDQAMAADSQLVKCSAKATTINIIAGTFGAVEVNTRVRQDAILLGMIGRHELNSSGTAVARPVSGISEADSAKQSTLPPPSVSPPSEDAPPETAPPQPPEDEVTPCDPDDDGDADNGDGGQDGAAKGDGPNSDGDADSAGGDADGSELEPCENPEPGS